MVEQSNANKYSNPLYLEIADRIANGICRDALWDHDRCNWLGWEMESMQRKMTPVYRAAAANLYCGTSGIALFLAELYRLTNDRQQLRTIEGAVNQALSVHQKLPANLQQSFFSGTCGIAFAMIRVGELLQRERLIDRGMSMLLSLRELPLDKKNIDVIGGSAGAIPALLWLAQKYQRAELTDFAVAHGQHLTRLAELSEHGCSWVTIPSPVKANLTGYAHGTAGMACALLELHHVTDDPAFLQVAESALQYERQWFYPAESNWEDLRQMGQESRHCSMGWCHGAPGIGLSRLRMLELQPHHSQHRVELDAAIASTAQALTQSWTPGAANYSLCHGAAGNAELMIIAAQRLQRPDLRVIADKVGQDGYEYYVRQGLPWPCGNSGAGETPNLMLGKAGIGHFYLRLYDTVQVPSILLISPDCA